MSKQKHFYSHLNLLEPVIIELSNLDLSDEERSHLIMIVHTNLHYIIVDLVLSHLSTEDKKVFIKHLENENHETTWSFLKEKTGNIEEKIKDVAENLKKELLNDIKKSKEDISKE
jgi:hypothetical protein